jgi:Transcriptional regulators of sugar metabolism
VDAIDFNIGFMNFSVEEIQAKKLMIQASKEIIILCDHSKFEKIVFVNICSLGDIDLLITGVETPKHIIA